MKRKILVVSQYFYPEQFRINDICKQWVKRGYDVTVLTGIPNYPQGEYFKGYSLFKNRKETYEGIKIIRLPLIPRKHNRLMLALNYGSFVLSGEIWKSFHRESFDKVFVYQLSPITQALPAISYAKKMNIACYIYVMDLWPENFEVIIGTKHKFMIHVINHVVDYVYANCRKIFTASNSFRENIIARGVESDKVFFLPQYAETFYQPTKEVFEELSKESRLKITFAGNIGYAQGLQILPEVAKKLKTLGAQVLFVLVGNGSYKQALINEIKKEQVEDYFHFVEPIPATDIPRLMHSSDFSLVSLKKDALLKLTIPAKVQSSMACGVPILLWADGEAKTIVEEAKCGIHAAAGEVTEAVESIKKALQLNIEEIAALGKNGRKYFEEKFEREYLLDKIDQYFEEE